MNSSNFTLVELNSFFMQSGKKIGRKIKEFREFRGITKEELAMKSNLDVTQLERIEEKGIVPSLGHLIRITRSLGVRLGTFTDDHGQTGAVIVRKEAKKEGSSFSTKNDSAREHLNFYPLAPEKSGRHMEPFFIEIEPDNASDHKLSSHEGEEFIYVLEGQVEVSYGKERHLLSEGDSIYLDSVVAHNVHAAGQNKVKLIGVVYYPV